MKKFWDKVDISSECWEWIAGKNQDGYGRFRFNGKKKQAHHVSFYLKHGRWPEYLLHSCDNPGCVNPDHLREGSHQENVLDCWAKGRGHKGKYWVHVDRARDLISCGVRNRDICRHLGVPNDFVSRLRHGTLYSS